jgi:hypothetical protein
MVHELPDLRGIEVTALKVGSLPIDETAHIAELGTGVLVNMLNESMLGNLTEEGGLPLHLGPYEGSSLRVVSSLRPAL